MVHVVDLVVLTPLPEKESGVTNNMVWPSRPTPCLEWDLTHLEFCGVGIKFFQTLQSTPRRGYGTGRDDRVTEKMYFTT